MTYRIHRSVTRDAVILALSGDLDAEHAATLKEFVANEAIGPIVLDLRDVTLVGRAAVQLLAHVEAEGIRLINCPGYVRSWIIAERDSGSSCPPSNRVGKSSEGDPDS